LVDERLKYLDDQSERAHYELAVAYGNIAIIRSQIPIPASDVRCRLERPWFHPSQPAAPELFRNLRSALGIKLRPVVIAIEFGLVAEQPRFAHAGERGFGHDASYPGNNRRQRSPAD
jgi:hypothetical protein